MLMDLAFDAHRDRAQAPGPFPRVHARNPRAAARGARRARKATRSSRVAEQIADEAKLLVLRRDAGHQHRRRDDPVAAVRQIDRAGREGRHDLQPAAARPLQGRAQPRAVPALHRADRAADAGRRGQRPDRLPARPPDRASRSGTCPTGRRRPPRSAQRLLPADRLSGRGPRQGADRGTRRRRRADAARAQRASRASRSSRSSGCAASRAAPPTISPSPGAITR